MSRSPAISTLLILAIFIASEVLSAPREERIPQELRDEKLVETREAEVLDERSKRLLRNERFDVSKEDQVLHRRLRVSKEPLASSNENEEKSSGTKKSTKLDGKSGNSRSSVEKSEIKDMNESYVTPQDDDDNPNDGAKLSTKVMEHPIDLTSDSKDSVPPAVFPNDDRVKSISDASPAMVDRLNKTNYTIDGTNITKNVGKTNQSTSDTINVVPMKLSTIPPTDVEATTILPPSAAPPTVNISESITTLAPTVTTEPTTITTTTTAEPKTEKVTKMSTKTTEIPKIIEDSEFVTDVTTTTDKSISSSQSPAEMLLHAKKMPEPPPLMPRGVVALITAISFTIVAVTVYIGLIVRRRFIEWRHGNRELLVNEFDATDISNFEL